MSSNINEIEIHNKLISAFTTIHQSSKNGGISSEELSAEVINQACLDILRLRKENKSTREIEGEIIQTYIEVAKNITPVFDSSYEAIAAIGIRRNVEWDGMWDFLRKYFKEKHNNDIDNVETVGKKFISNTHERYENGKLISSSTADRIISIQFWEEYDRMMVEIEPTLTPKIATLILCDDLSNYKYVGDDKDYLFEIEMIEGWINKFTLYLVPKNLKVVYYAEHAKGGKEKGKDENITKRSHPEKKWWRLW